MALYNTLIHNDNVWGIYQVLIMVYHNSENRFIYNRKHWDSQFHGVNQVCASSYQEPKIKYVFDRFAALIQTYKDEIKILQQGTDLFFCIKHCVSFTRAPGFDSRNQCKSFLKLFLSRRFLLHTITLLNKVQGTSQRYQLIQLS